MQLIEGKRLAQELLESVGRDVRTLTAETGIYPTLAVVLVGQDPASQVYVGRKIAASKRAGIRSIEHRLDAGTSQDMLLTLIRELNGDRNVHGILVQLPMPAQIDPAVVLDAIDPSKDVDGFHPVNVGRLSVGSQDLVPCTPLGCMMLLDTVFDSLSGLHAVVIGKSNIVGKPVALMLLERECTVSVTHIATRDLPDIVRRADIVVVAAGSAGLVRGDWVKAGAVVIDVGINRILEDGRPKIVGDARIDEMAHVAAITPVPGGVGPMTVACLMANTIRAARKLACGN